jgi:hypothetical protein
MRKNVSLEWKGDMIKKTAKQAGRKGLKDSLEFILAESNKLVPHDEGTLQASGNVSIDDLAIGIRGSVYYDTPYAARLHENPQYNFNKGRQGKYLEKAIYDNADRIRNYLKRYYPGIFKFRA